MIVGGDPFGDPFGGGAVIVGGPDDPFGNPFGGGAVIVGGPDDPFGNPFGGGAVIVGGGGVIVGDPFPGNPDPFSGSSRVSIQRVTANGDGCPTRNSTQVFVRDTGNGRQVLSIGFNSNSPDDFQVFGPGEDIRNCTVRTQLRVDSNDGSNAFDVRLGRALAGVSFVNRSRLGVGVVTSAFRLNNGNTTQLRLQLPNSNPNPSLDLDLGSLGLSARSGRIIDVVSNVQIELLGQNNATLRFDDLNMELFVRSRGGNNGGGGAIVIPLPPGF